MEWTATFRNDRRPAGRSFSAGGNPHTRRFAPDGSCRKNARVPKNRPDSRIGLDYRLTPFVISKSDSEAGGNHTAGELDG